MSFRNASCGGVRRCLHREDLEHPPFPRAGSRRRGGQAAEWSKDSGVPLSCGSEEALKNQKVEIVIFVSNSLLCGGPSMLVRIGSW